MSQAETRFSYLLYLDDEAIALDGSMTLGNHLENDVVIAGEDVADFHVRIEVTDRGPVAVPLGQATLNLNGVEMDRAVRCVLGDVIGIGQTTVQLGIEIEQAPTPAWDWSLVSAAGERIAIEGEHSIGRSDSADITIADSHISRFHARLIERSGLVWLQDLASANGTRVNGEKLAGGVQLFHGDRINFDRYEFQIVAQGGDLTPVNRYEDPLKPTSAPLPRQGSEEADVIRESKPQKPPGVYRYALVDQTSGEQIPLGAGDVELAADGHGVPRAIEAGGTGALVRVTVSADGVLATELNSRAALKVNEQAVTAHPLAAGDVVNVFERTFRFEELAQDAAQRDRPPYRLIGIGIAVLVAIVLAVALT